MYIIKYNYYENTSQIQPGKFHMKIPALYHVPKPRGSELPHRVDTVALATAHQLFGFPGRSKKNVETLRDLFQHTSKTVKPTGWCPPVISWFINPINYSYICHKP
jgi:hypothetical protein